MLVTLSGMLMLSSAMQPKKAKGAMLVTLLGMLMLARLPHSLKAPMLMFVTPSPTTADLMLDL